MLITVAALVSVAASFQDDVMRHRPLVFLVLSSPVDSPIEGVPSGLDFLESCKAVCMELEIMDPREQNYYFSFSYPGDMVQSDLRVMRVRYHELKDAPKLASIATWPDRNIFTDRCAFNRKFRSHVEELYHLESDRKAYYAQVLAECDRLYKLNDLAWDASCEFYYNYIRRRSAKMLLDLYEGENPFEDGGPPAAPYWRFNELVTPR